MWCELLCEMYNLTFIVKLGFSQTPDLGFLLITLQDSIIHKTTERAFRELQVLKLLEIIIKQNLWFWRPLWHYSAGATHCQSLVFVHPLPKLGVPRPCKFKGSCTVFLYKVFLHQSPCQSPAKPPSSLQPCFLRHLTIVCCLEFINLRGCLQFI